MGSHFGGGGSAPAVGRVRRLGLASLTLLSACGGEPRAAAQARLGAELYGTRCAVCHDQDATIGTRLDAATLRSYRTAAALYNYTSFSMPYDAPRSLVAEEYWAVTAHMLRSRGLIEPELLLGPENADSVHWADAEANRTAPSRDRGMSQENERRPVSHR